MRPSTTATLAVLALVGTCASAAEPSWIPARTARSEPTTMTPMFVPSPIPVDQVVLPPSPPTTKPGVVTRPPAATEAAPATPTLPTQPTPPTPTQSTVPTPTTQRVGPQDTEASDPIPLLTTTTAPPPRIALRRSTLEESLEPTSGSSSSPTSESDDPVAVRTPTTTSTASTTSTSTRPATTTNTVGGSSSNSSASGDFLDPALTHACICKDVRKVSLMSASDYCLLPSAIINNKCGNAAVGEKGECPRAEAQPCQDTGHVLRYDAICAYDKRDEVYKCVASKEDLYEQKFGRRKKQASSNRTANAADRATSLAATTTSHHARLLALAASCLVGLAVVA